MAVMKKQKWLFENGCKCNSKISTVTEFLNWCQYGKNTSKYLGITLKNNDIIVEQMSYIVPM